jgi:hypothetical protein
MTMLTIAALTTAEWIVAVVSALGLLASMVPIVWLTWRFIQMDDGAVVHEVENAQRLAKAKEEIRRRLAA